MTESSAPSAPGAPPGTLTLRDVETLVSRLCHDLVGPVGAIRNGLEVMEDAEEGGSVRGGDFGADALQLVTHSAEQAARRLLFYRLAWGRAGGEGSAGFGPAREAALAWLEGGRVRATWALHSPPPSTAGRKGVLRMILNLLLLGSDLVPAGGEVHVSGDGSETSGWVCITARGRPPWRMEILAPLRPERPPLPGQDVSATRLIPALLVQRFAADNGFDLQIREDPGVEISFRFHWN